jgi:5-methylcytosine-specific restriction protein A
MPTSARSRCTWPGCPQLAVKRGRCREHRDQRSRERYASTWRKLSAYVLARDHWCVQCNYQRATQVDHIVARSKGGTDDLSNLRGLCATCHSRKTTTEDQARDERGEFGGTKT